MQPIVQTFVKFMDDNSKLRNMIDTGKGNLQWERDIPADALANLQQLAQTNFRYVHLMINFDIIFQNVTEETLDK